MAEGNRGFTELVGTELSSAEEGRQTPLPRVTTLSLPAAFLVVSDFWFRIPD